MKDHRNIADWQVEIAKLAKLKGYHWKPEEIDSCLLRIISEASEASEWLRDADLTKWLEPSYRPTKVKHGEIFDIKTEVALELADIFHWLCTCADALSVNLNKAVIKKQEINATREHLHGHVRK